MATVDDKYILEVERLKNKLVKIANRYLKNEDKLDETATLNDVVNVLDEFDEYTYMNALFNSIEVFPTKDYSINDVKGHIKGLNNNVFNGNSAIKSLCLNGVTSISQNNRLGATKNLEVFRSSSLIEMVNYGDSPPIQSDVIREIYVPKLTIISGRDEMLNKASFENLNLPSLTSLTGRNLFGSNSGIKTILIGGKCNFKNSNQGMNKTAHLSALILTNQSALCTLAGTNITDDINNSTNCIVYVPSALKNSYQSATNWTIINDNRPIQDIESNINLLRELGADFSFTYYANKKWANSELIIDDTIDEEIPE